MYSLLSLHAMQAYKSEGTDPLIHNLSTRQRLLASLMPHPLCPVETVLVPTEEDAGWEAEPTEIFWKTENLLPLLEFKPQIIQPVPWSLHQLCYPGPLETFNLLF